MTADGKLLNQTRWFSGDAAQNVVVQLLHKDDTVIDIVKHMIQYTQDKDKVAIGNSRMGKRNFNIKHVIMQLM